MPTGPRPRHEPTDDWDQLRLLVTSPEQETYELLRPIVLFGQPASARARETGVARAHPAAQGRPLRGDRACAASSTPDRAAAPDRRRLPLGIRRAIVELKAEYPPFGRSRDRAHLPAPLRPPRQLPHRPAGAGHRAGPLPLHPPRRFPRYHDIADPVARRKAIVDLYLDGWSAKAIAGYLATSRPRSTRRCGAGSTEGLPGLADRSRAPHHPARKVDLKAMAAIRRLQANPELGEFRIHAALAQQGIHLSPAHLRPHPGAAPGAGRAAAGRGACRTSRSRCPSPPQRRHQYWSVDIRYIEDHALGTGKPVYVISILENFSRALLASAISPRQDLTAYLIVLRAAVETHGAPEVLVSDSGGVFKAKQAQAIYAALGIAQRRDRPRARPGRTTSRPTST